MSTVHVLAAELRNGDMPLGEAVTFWILGPIAVAGALGTVILRNAIHSALSLVATMFTLGAFYLIQQGPFLGLVQIIVYTGAIMILFLFVLMLIGRDSSDSLVETLRGQRWAALLFGIGFAVIVGVAIARAFTGIRPKDLNGPNANGNNVHSIAELLFTRYLFAFELTSALLIVAAIGAMVLAHIERDEPKPTQKSLARARIRSGRPQPLPGPGVLSSGNSIGTPALLPDGSISHESVLAGIGAEHAGPSDWESGRERRELGEARMDEAEEYRP
jgi:NADH-quinone oxidoreductase subunit J